MEYRTDLKQMLHAAFLSRNAERRSTPWSRLTQPNCDTGALDRWTSSNSAIRTSRSRLTRRLSMTTKPQRVRLASQNSLPG